MAHGNTWRPWVRGRLLAVTGALLPLVLAAAVVPSDASAVTVRAAAEPAPVQGANLVLNPGHVAGVEGWSAASGAGTVTLRRVGLATGDPAPTAVEVTRPAGGGAWALALAALRQPTTTFVVGRTYRMQAWVRDLGATGADLGMLLANGNYDHRPSDASVWAGYRDTSWHLLTRTFVCRSAASSDTGLYLSLPDTGDLRWQVAAPQVVPVAAPVPATVSGAPSQTLDFSGAAGSAPDPQVWNHEVGGHGWGNGERQTYTASTRNAAVDGAGRLRITARRETRTGPDGIPRDYTSARLTTQGKVVVQPGSYVEASIKAPVGRGVWPAFWLVGADITDVGWPSSGELDVLEGHGGHPTTAYRAIHTSSLAKDDVDVPFGWGEDGGAVDLGEPLDAGFHRYGVYFDQNLVRFYLDRREVMSFWAADAGPSGRTWPFDQPQYLVLNVAVGGGDPSATTFPRTMEVSGISMWSGGVPSQTSAG